MDFNQHMRNAAFLAFSEDTRMLYLDAHGWTMQEFAQRRLGPVVVEDRLQYRKELRLLEPFHVDMTLAAITGDGRKMKLCNRFLRGDGVFCAVVESVVLWFDLEARAPVAPPVELRDLWLALERSDDFEAM